MYIYINTYINIYIYLFELIWGMFNFIQYIFKVKYILKLFNMNIYLMRRNKGISGSICSQFYFQTLQPIQIYIYIYILLLNFARVLP